MAHNNRKPNMLPYTLKDFQKQFPDDATCLEWLRNRLYPEGIYCLKCEATTKHHRVASRPSYSCDHCGHHVHPTAGTIFHKSPTPLTTWFYAIYLMAQTRCGISAKQIQRETGVTYKTAWRMFKQIRSMLDDEKAPPLGGKGKGVEIDETYMGGKRKRGTGRPMAGDKVKTVVVGIVERRGKVKALVANDVKGSTLLGMVKEHVLPKSTVFTDELNAYHGIEHMPNMGYRHRRINHTSGVYVVGETHTNTVEGFWSLIKNGIRGVYHNVGKSYLQTYLNEYSFRYNRRHDTTPMFISFLHQVEKRDAVIRQLVPIPEPF
ncbi:MAG TPA: IS1595 family transposase [Candidatus Aquilonibacter sp.]|jgi:transposase|nr:IS1595 family transposase [Candidatus Aquilonibacter sp.]